jgi:hypothetical protein
LSSAGRKSERSYVAVAAGLAVVVVEDFAFAGPVALGACEYDAVAVKSRAAVAMPADLVKRIVALASV